MSQQTLYYRAHIKDEALLYPDQLNGDLETYLLENIRETNEKKVAEKGYIVKINRVLERKNGTIDMSNFNTNAIVPVKYDCYLCSPQEDMEIIARVRNTTVKRIIIAENGPVEVAIKGKSIDTTKFVLQDNVVYKIGDSKPISVGDYVKVIIVNTKYVKGFKNITVMAKLIDMASESEIAQFKRDMALVYGDEEDEEMI